jgi:hypothetical protein
MASRLNVPWMKFILPQAPVYELPPSNEYQSWTQLSITSLAMSMIVNLPGQAAAIQQTVQAWQEEDSQNIGEQLMRMISDVGMAGPYRRLEVTLLLLLFSSPCPWLGSI